jgi:SPP1 gp7 family putative phage head morphogenesis protein
MNTNSNTDLFDKKLNRAAMVRLFENKVTGVLMVEYDGHVERLDQLIRKSKVRGKYSDEFYEALDKELVKTFGSMKNISERHMIDLVRDQSSFTTNAISSVTGDIWKTQRPTKRIAEDIVLNTPLYKNTTLSQGWADISLNEKKRLEGVIRKGIAEGLTENQIADTILKGSFHKVTRQQAVGLARTGITSVIAQTDHEVYKANKDLLRGWQYVAVLDSRTTPLCAHRDGTVYPISDTAHLPPAHWHCYLEDTEILTENGFKLIKDTIIGERCLSLDPKTEDLTWQPIITKFEKEVDELILIKSKTVDMAVSVDHPFIGQKRVDRGSYKEYLPKYYTSILDIPRNADFRLFASSKWKGNTPSEIVVNGFKFPSIEVFCKFMAWWLSDGSVTVKKAGYVDCKIAQETHKALMIKELELLNPTERADGIGFLDQRLNNWLLKFGKCTDKYIPIEIKELSKEDILIFLNAYLLGDGSSSKMTDFEGYESKEVRRFFTTSKQVMADLCELIIKVGDSVSVRENKSSYVVRESGEIIKGNHIVYHISWNRSQYRRLQDCDISVENEDVYKVYDVELADKHTLLTKRNGKIIWGSNCRSTTVPVVKSYEQLSSLEGIAQIRKRNLKGLSPETIAYYDGQTPLGETYNDWLRRQPTDVQLKHLGDYQRLELFRTQQLTLDKFTDDGEAIDIKTLRRLTDAGIGVPGDTRKFAIAKDKLDAIKLGAVRPEDFYENPELVKNLREYYLLQAKDLGGTLSLINYRGVNIGTKKATKMRVLNSPPSEQNLRYNPLTGRYDDARMYTPQLSVLENQLNLLRNSDKLLDEDKLFIENFIRSFEGHLGANERAVLTDNLRIIFTRFRENKEPWGNLKGVIQGQIKFDIMNVSDTIETQLRKDADLIKKLQQKDFLDPVLGPSQLQNLHDNLIKNIMYVNKWDDTTAPKIGRELRNILDRKIPPKLWVRLSDRDLEEFYTSFARRLSLADSPDRDQLAVSLGRDLYNKANYRGSRREWFELGKKILDDANEKGFFVLDSYGVQKKRMKSKMGNHYFGAYLDTEMVFLRITDKRILDYSKKVREVDVGLRVSNVTDKPRLVARKNYKTYFVDRGLLGWYDTRIPVTSTDAFSDFPVSMMDADMVNALNWAGQSRYRIDPEFHDFIEKLMYFRDDKGRASYYDELNTYRHYMVERGDSYERFKTMRWYRDNDYAFSNLPFLDHRARIYERGFVGPQSGESLFK